MIRICDSLSNAGYEIFLVGRKTRQSGPLHLKAYHQKRLPCFFEKGKWFYAEYNLRLFFYLLFKNMHGICAIDLDTILPVYILSRIKKTVRIYDAHELFCEMKEVVTRPRIYKMWKWIERKTVPHFKHGYTVNEVIAAEFNKMYGLQYAAIRSIARYAPNDVAKEKYIFYQGAVNEGRSFETLIPAMRSVPAQLIICGDGNYMPQAKALVDRHGLNQQVIFKGMLRPDALKAYSSKAYIGITLFEKNGLSNYYSLANRFFDYIQAGIPQLCVAFPEYEKLNKEYEVALLIDDLGATNIAGALNRLLTDDAYWQRLHEHTLAAAKVLNWEREEKKLIAFYTNIFG